MLHTPTTNAGRQALEALRADPSQALLALDFDGTLAPIVDDPAQAHVHPRSVAALAQLGSRLGRVAVITGRPVRTALRLGGFAAHPGLGSMTILGQYGVERWDAGSGQIAEPEAPAGIVALAEMLPRWLADRGLAEFSIEDKARAVVLHARGLRDSDRLLSDSLPEFEGLAAEFGLVAEPGRHVIELRDGALDKGIALRALVSETGVRNVLFAGDDLGDLPAFRVAESLRAEGMTALLAYSASDEQDALKAHADLILDGTDAVADWLESLADLL